MSRRHYRSLLGLVLAIASLGCGNSGTGGAPPAPASTPAAGTSTPAAPPSIPPPPGTPPPPPKAIAVTLTDSMGTAGEDVPCLATVTDKTPRIKPDTTITWTINGNGCKGGYDSKKLAMKFGKNTKLFVDKNTLKDCKPDFSDQYVCAITATIVDTTKVKDKSRHPYGITLDEDDLGDPEIDIDNGSGAPPPPSPPPTGD